MSNNEQETEAKFYVRDLKKVETILQDSGAHIVQARVLERNIRFDLPDASLRSGRWDRERFQGVELHGKTLGIVGLGRVGTMVAQRSLAFGMSQGEGPGGMCRGPGGPARLGFVARG